MPTFPIDVRFYDEKERQRIQANFPLDFALINARIGLVNVPLEDFQVYSLFRHQCDHPGYATFKDFLPGAERHWGENEVYLEQKSGSGNLICKYPGDIEAKNIAESIGVAGGLSVFGHLYGLHQADWKRIGIKSAKDLDFTRASSIDGRTINVELKGSIIDDNNIKTSPISNHKANIQAKKVANIMLGTYNPSIDTCLSSIVVISKSDQPVKCWLLDPPSDEITPDPNKSRLLRRLYFYGEILSWISPRSFLSITLLNRIRAIEATTNYEDLNRLKLVKADDVEIVNNNFILSRPHVLIPNYFGQLRFHDDLICGCIGITREGALWFVGLPITAIQMLAEQDFEFILGYRQPSNSFPGVLEANLQADDFKRMARNLLQRVKVLSEGSESLKQIKFQLEMRFHMSSSGLLFARAIQ